MNDLVDARTQIWGRERWASHWAWCCWPPRRRRSRHWGTARPPPCACRCGGSTRWPTPRWWCGPRGRGWSPRRAWTRSGTWARSAPQSPETNKTDGFKRQLLRAWSGHLKLQTRGGKIYAWVAFVKYIRVSSFPTLCDLFSPSFWVKFEQCGERRRSH